MKNTKIRGAKFEKIKRSYLAITDYNDKATDKNEKWYLGLRILAELSGCNGQDVSLWINENKQAIEEHNSKHELGVHHNKVHKISIIQVISW